MSVALLRRFGLARAEPEPVAGDQRKDVAVHPRGMPGLAGLRELADAPAEPARLPALVAALSRLTRPQRIAISRIVRPSAATACSTRSRKRRFSTIELSITRLSFMRTVQVECPDRSWAPIAAAVIDNAGS